MRPERRNALNSQLILELTQALDAAAESKSGVVILTGAGSAFCAGLDLEHLQSMTAKTPAEHRKDSEGIRQLVADALRFSQSDDSRGEWGGHRRWHGVGYGL